MTDKNHIILAPHIDDEVIGCFRLLDALKVSDVYYFFDCTERRRFEAEVCAFRYGFKPHFVVEEKDCDSLFLPVPESVTVWIPSIYDKHPHHKWLNAKFRSNKGIQKSFYSVDMNVPIYDILSPEERKRKQVALSNLFPSQKDLFDNNDKYHLFESNKVLDGISTSLYTWSRWETTVEASAFGEVPVLDVVQTQQIICSTYSAQKMADILKTTYPKFGFKVTVKNQAFSIPL